MPSSSTALATAPAALPSNWQILLVGNREEDFFLIRDILHRKHHAFVAELDHVHSVEEAQAMLRYKTHHLILFDHGTTDGKAIRLLFEGHQSGLSIPFVLLTEQADEKTVADLIAAGASDCINHTELNGANLLRTMRCTLALHSMQQGRHNAEESIRKLSHAVEQSADAIMITNRQGILEYVNPAFEALTGYSRGEVIGQTPQILKSGEQGPEVYRDMWKTILSGNVYRGILVNRKKNGELYYIEENISPVRDPSGTVTHFVSHGRDLTDRLRLEAQLVQSQKMDAIGRLAGGVAHDFNNLLTIITSYSELALDAVTPGGPIQCKLQKILSAARRAAQLTRQLLAFSRKQVQALRVLELNPVVEDIAKTLQRLVGEDIELIFEPGEKLGRVRLDPVQLEQILMNLAANARDAMPQGGKMTVETSAAYLDSAYIASKSALIPPGHYVRMTVSDTGAGIPPESLPHIFEPFYTTKPSGEGTGLGLATVYGIVKQNSGFIWAYSELGMGTVSKIYLPCVTDQSRPLDPITSDEAPMLRGSETVLLVEDEPAVRDATCEFLKFQGYTVLEAADGLDALAIVVGYRSPFHLIVSDVVMPNMSGGQLAKELESRGLHSRFLFVSGYPGKTVIDHKVLDFEANFLQKPFTLKQLSTKIREVLAQPYPASV